MKLNHLVVTGEIRYARATLTSLHNRGLLLELLDCAPVMDLLFWEKQKLHQITDNQMPDLVFGETGGSQRLVIKRNKLLVFKKNLNSVFKFYRRWAGLAVRRSLQFLWIDRFKLLEEMEQTRLSKVISGQSHKPK